MAEPLDETLNGPFGQFRTVIGMRIFAIVAAISCAAWTSSRYAAGMAASSSLRRVRSWIDKLDPAPESP